MNYYIEENIFDLKERCNTIINSKIKSKSKNKKNQKKIFK